ncbi:hypothetical protein M2G36_20865 [Vibrio vulnificus]|nr:hypothetical protein [Vibrio vulnificus]
MKVVCGKLVKAAFTP